MSCAFSDDGINGDNENGITASRRAATMSSAPWKSQIVCGFSTGTRMFRTSPMPWPVCDHQVDTSAFIEDIACTGDLVTEGSEPFWN